MAPRPWQPARELAGALDRGDLRYAVALAEELRVERQQPIELRLALRFLPLIAQRSPGEYDAWALRWLARWATEQKAATVERAAQVAAALAAMRTEPTAICAISDPAAGDAGGAAAGLDRRAQDN